MGPAGAERGQIGVELTHLAEQAQAIPAFADVPKRLIALVRLEVSGDEPEECRAVEVAL